VSESAQTLRQSRIGNNIHNFQQHTSVKVSADCRPRLNGSKKATTKNKPLAFFGGIAITASYDLIVVRVESNSSQDDKCIHASFDDAKFLESSSRSGQQIPAVCLHSHAQNRTNHESFISFHFT